MKVNKSIICLSLAALLSTTALAGNNGSGPNGKPFIELAGQIVEVQSDISTLEDEHDALVAQVNKLELDLQGQIEAISAEITTLKATDASLQASLQSKISALAEQGTAIDALISALTEVNSDLITLANTAEDNATAIESLETDKSAILDDIATLDGGISTAMAEIVDNATLIGMLEDDIAQLTENKQNDVQGSCPEGTSVVNVSDDGSLVCGDINSGGTIKTLTVISAERDYNNSVEKIKTCVVPSPSGGCLEFTTETNYNLAAGPVFAECPEGYVVTGGGLQIRSAIEKLQAFKQKPQLKKGLWNWVVFFKNHARSNTKNTFASAVAQCSLIE
ncbi:hypothetical protein RI844_02175 [Thalassotalea fonticola]|uniref:Uncharacterized protein n=1 Tax=Thalassotalea fonticola TaxID=3065649 RepID=A0ABZ0GQI3_9GAMM|nr:hypothetical protein RI844_02175 [Colwelliaceae bacterium S1-1]